jgi:hypothetical protein
MEAHLVNLCGLWENAPRIWKTSYSKVLGLPSSFLVHNTNSLTILLWPKSDNIIWWGAFFLILSSVTTLRFVLEKPKHSHCFLLNSCHFEIRC